MHLLIDAFAVRTGSSSSVVGGLLRGWAQLAPDDTITVVSAGELPFALPVGARHEIITAPVGGKLGGLWERTFGVRVAARRFRPDLVISGVTASAFFGTGTRRAVVVTDVRHEILPHQFSLARRLVRRLSYGWSFRFADAFVCISQRTVDDIARTHPRTRGRAIAAVLGADHAEDWEDLPPTSVRHPYALAFGQSENKNVSAVLEAWTQFTEPGWTLRLVGMGRADREAASAKVAELALADRVELTGWLDDDEFAALFAGADLIVFPSDFEGFGMPAVEAQRLGIPVVISADPALAEVTGGHAEVVDPVTATALADGMRRALAHTPEQLAAAREWSRRLTWRAMATAVRDALSGN